MGRARSTLLASFLNRVDWTRVSRVETRRYGPHYLTPSDARQLDWGAFVGKLPVLFASPIGRNGLHVAVAAKSVTWSDRDLNVYVGDPTRPVRSVWDLTPVEFTEVFGWHIEVARQVSAALGRDVYFTHGFNPDDTSPDAHSIASKFHTHLHIPQEQGRRPVTVAGLTNFERLALIEPYSQLCHDRAASFLASRVGNPWRIRPAFGFTSLTAPLPRATAALTLLHEVLADLHSPHREVAAVITDGTEETATGHIRYVPRPQAERTARMADFVHASAAWLSASSAELLTYLARHVERAVPRDSPRSTRIVTSGQVWIAKGLSGALNFVVSVRSGSTSPRGSSARPARRR